MPHTQMLEDKGDLHNQSWVVNVESATLIRPSTSVGQNRPLHRLGVCGKTFIALVNVGDGAGIVQ
jgi:hypothetical protein